MSSVSKTYEVIIAGGGPAGTSAAIHLASRGLSVLLVEKSTFPRPKLCGEFISPECLQHFEKLGVAAEMKGSRPALIGETIFFSRRGRKTIVPSSWFGGIVALGLSRATMDHNLLSRARSVGVDVMEGSTVTKIIENEKGVLGIGLRKGEGDFELFAPILVDATGRARSLARRVGTGHWKKPKLVAFKAHLENTNASPTACEIYSYPGGYGGISQVEDGLSNLCFIVDAELVKESRSNPERVMRRNVMRNPRAAFALNGARVCTEWLSVAIESFGRYRPSPIRGLLAIGDAASFIDPFTGSGMLMALESGDLAAQTIVRHQDKLSRPETLDLLGPDYTQAYRRKFDSRLRICGLLRRVAFRPLLAQLTIAVCASSDHFSGWLARATRSNLKHNPT